MATAAEPAPMTESTSSHPRILVRMHHRKPGQPTFSIERIEPGDPRYDDLAPGSHICPHPARESRIEARIVRVSRRLDELSKKMGAAQGKVPDWAKRAIDWLQRQKPHDEELMRGLCSAESVHVLYPASWKPSRARKQWRHLIRKGRRTHLLRLAVVLVLLPLSLVLTVVPGPNVLGFWFSYRAMSHALSWLGAGRVLQGGLPIGLQPDAEPVGGAVTGPGLPVKIG